MTGAVPQHLADRLQQHNQQHLLKCWDDLDADQRTKLLKQIESVDFDLIDRLYAMCRADDAAGDSSNNPDSPAERAKRAAPPSQLIRLPKTDADREQWTVATARGNELLAAGKVGVVLVAGGQGARLDFPHPKGMFPIGPVSGCSLFQMLAEQVLARSRIAGVTIPYYIMTSEATHAETAPFFEQHNYFGLNPAAVHFFQQGSLPAVDDATGRLLLADKATLSTSPDGHGGMLPALSSSGLLADMRQRGIEYLFYHQVDNPAAIVCDPAFLGFHAIRESDLSTKVVAKASAAEKMGVVVDVDGQTQIIEYSDLPEELAQQTDASGDLRLWSGNTAIHIFNVEFLQRIVDQNLELPFHLAHKPVAHLNDNGGSMKPEKPNAYKFERFIFDALPHAQTALVFEADRAREFHPVKNKSIPGEDTPDTPEKSRAALTQIFTDWLRAAGAEVPQGTPIEISPLVALSAEQVSQSIDASTNFRAPTHLR